jgi:hypothetical protein
MRACFTHPFIKSLSFEIDRLHGYSSLKMTAARAESKLFKLPRAARFLAGLFVAASDFAWHSHASNAGSVADHLNRKAQ